MLSCQSEIVKEYSCNFKISVRTAAFNWLCPASQIIKKFTKFLTRNIQNAYCILSDILQPKLNVPFLKEVRLGYCSNQMTSACAVGCWGSALDVQYISLVRSMVIQNKIDNSKRAEIMIRV